jgi:lipoate-protein ligase A
VRWESVFKRRAEIREHLLNIIDKFRQKGAVSPEKAMTAEELGLPNDFKERMKRRLGRLGVFVEVNGKYYLSEERLKEVQGKIAERRRNRSW